MREFTDGDFPFAVEFNAFLQGQLQGDAVLSGCSVSINTGSLDQNDTIQVASGSISINGTEHSVSQQNLGIDSYDLTASSDDSNVRYDIVSIDNTGTASVTKGTTIRVTESIPTDEVLVAVVKVPEGDSSIQSADLFDSRVVASELIGQDITVFGNLTRDNVTVSSTLTVNGNFVDPQGNDITDFVGTLLELNSGSLQVNEDSISHDNIADVSANDHIDNLTDIPTRNHNDLNNIGNNDHHSPPSNLDDLSGISKVASGNVTISSDSVAGVLSNHTLSAEANVLLPIVHHDTSEANDANWIVGHVEDTSKLAETKEVVCAEVFKDASGDVMDVNLINFGNNSHTIYYSIYEITV